jgi:hypothetical protein
MQTRPLLIRFIDKQSYLGIPDTGFELLSFKTLDNYFHVLEINLLDLFVDSVYLGSILKRISEFQCNSYKIFINVHSFIDKDLNITFSMNKFRIEHYRLINFLKALNKPIEILNFSCYGGLGKFINELPEGSYIIDVGNAMVADRNLVHLMYSYPPVQEYLYANGIDFYKILALYCLFNTSSTNDKPVISTKNKTIDIDEEYQRFTIYDHLDLLANDFIKHLRDYRIITPAMLKCMIHVLNSKKPNYSFSYTFAQFLIDMQEEDFPNNIVKKFSKYYSSRLEVTLLDKVKINKKLLEPYIKNKIKYINPFMFFLHDFNDRDVYTPYYSYQKFLVIVMKFIK